jgi:Peptidase family S41
MFFIVINLKRIIRFAAVIILLVNTSSCEKVLEIKDPAINAAAVYDDMWNAMEKNYALFSIKGINWDSVYNKNRPLATGDLSNANLFKLLTKSLEVLKDGHVALISPETIFTYEGFYKPFPSNFNLINVEKNYLKNQYNKLGPVIYKVVDSLAYLYYASFRDNISDEEVDKLFASFSTTRGLIIDVRNNTGGTLSNAEKIFSRLINSEKLVKYEMVKKGTGHIDFYDKQPYYVKPAGNYYSKPIILLTNRTCFSACNDFALYMSYLPNVRIVGDQTGGGGAIPANYILVNGWKLQYSASITLSPENLSVENGILPDYAVGITPLQDAIGSDPILEKAYSLLK